MQRVAMVGTIKSGKEADLWRALDRLGDGNGDGGDAPSFETYVGSGYVVMVLDAPLEDFQDRFREQFNGKPLQMALRAIEPYVEGFPDGRYLTGDQEREREGEGGHRRKAGFSSADLPLAALAARFSADEGFTTFTEQNNSAAGTRKTSPGARSHKTRSTEHRGATRGDTADAPKR